jgi:hypothetical protein
LGKQGAGGKEERIEGFNNASKVEGKGLPAGQRGMNSER